MLKRTRSSATTASRRAVAIALLAVAAFGACGDGDGDGDDDAAGNAATTTTTAKAAAAPKGPEPKLNDTTLDREVKLTIRGDQTANIEGVHKLRIVVRKGDGDWRPYSIASVTWPTPIDLGEKRSLMPEIALVGMFGKDGSFTLPAGIGPAPTTGPTAPKAPATTESVSVAQATFVDFAASTETRYGYLLESCKITTKSDATEGTAKCPALVSVDGKKISLDFTWSKP